MSCLWDCSARRSSWGLLGGGYPSSASRIGGDLGLALCLATFAFSRRASCLPKASSPRASSPWLRQRPCAFGHRAAGLHADRNPRPFGSLRIHQCPLRWSVASGGVRRWNPQHKACHDTMGMDYLHFSLARMKRLIVKDLESILKCTQSSLQCDS
ncbi:hypothetical protein PVAP13_1NG202619 [Panicum virgatum]|uniref:Uncharacterized protein n=1 Tax=Panicum virgatum TaxID=38727 RepID=A0A8T0WKP3_PANVG|nr:hypothetical protein PVAP13_1NG202619 [Panicum virgatum]